MALARSKFARMARLAERRAERQRTAPAPPTERIVRRVRLAPFAWASTRRYFDLADVNGLEPGEAIVYEFATAHDLPAFRASIYRTASKAGRAYMTRSDGHWLVVARCE